MNESYGTYLVVLLSIATAIYYYIKQKYNYWKVRNFPYLEAAFPFGNFENPFARKTPYALELKNLYEQLKQMNVEHGGIYSFTTPVYIPVAVDKIKAILSKDFFHFTERGRYYNEKDDPVSAHLFHIGGPKWKAMRAKMTPTFTSGKIKIMFEGLLSCVDALVNVLEEKCKNGPLDVRDFADRFTSDVILSCVFGIKCNSIGGEVSEFLEHGLSLTKVSLSEAVRLLFIFSFPDLARSLGVRRYKKTDSDFFIKTIKDIVEYRERNRIRRNDFLQILIDLKNKEEKTENEKLIGAALTVEQMAAECLVFFIAGFDTSAAVISFTLYELALNHEIQRKAREEIKEVLSNCNERLTYENIAELKYLQQLVDETLRKYPSLPLLNRQCVENYKLGDSDLVLEKGTQIIVPLMGLHYDQELFPEPEKYDPERFSPENKPNIKPFSYLPFGDGPRNCLGMRFGYMQTKVSLAMLINDFEFSLNAKTKQPLELGNKVILCPKGGLWLDIVKI